MSCKEIGFHLRYFLKNVVNGKLVSSILSSFGSLWLIVEIGTYFLGEKSQIIIWLKNQWCVFLILGIFIAIILSKPKLTISSKLNNRDITIEVTVGNFFKQNGALVISSNTTFDTHISKELISKKSIQGQFTKQLYYDNETQIDRDISVALENIKPEILTGKRIGKNKKYPIGTTIRLSPKDKTVYLIAIADINEHGVASASYENLKQALAYLWLYIRLV